MILSEDQKETLLRWIAEGLKTNEINKRAAVEFEPFKVSRQQVDYYRKTRNADIQEILQQREFKALNTGLAKASERIEVLKKLAGLMMEDLFENNKLWTTDKKSIGSGSTAEIYAFKVFNRSEVDALRGVLDDIAKEMGERVAKTEVSPGLFGEYTINFKSPFTETVSAE
jgi:hypothetical protein